MLFRQTIILTVITLCMHSVYAQVSTSEGDNTLITKATFIKTDSGIFIQQPALGKCRQKISNSFFIPNPSVEVVLERRYMEPQIEKEKFLTVHGNITYFFNYRSYIDTPFAENDVMQHAVQTRLDMMFREKYPFTVYLTSRRSNSDFFSNATDVSFQFHQAQMLDNIKRDMRTGADKFLLNKSLSLTPAQLYQREKDGLLKNIGNFSDLNIKEKVNKTVKAKQKEIEEKFKKMYEEYKTKVAKLDALKADLKRTNGAQELVEEKERKLRGSAVNTKDIFDKLAKEGTKKLGGLATQKTDSLIKSAQELVADKEKMLRNGATKIKDSAENIAKAFVEKKIADEANKADSLMKVARKKVEEKKQELENLQKEVAQAEQKLKLYQKGITDSLQKIKRLIGSISDKNKLEDYLQKTGGSIKEIPALQRLLLSVKQIGLGRSWIDYSELTVKNISLTGFNIEMNPNNIYFAAAAGKVNYRFRDYIVKGNYAGSNQSVGLIRAGFGKKDNNNVIVTYYAGQKALLTQTSPTDAATQKISGFSLETRKKINEHNYIIGEYARSTSPTLASKTFNFSNNTNEAFSIKLFSDYGNTKVNGYYRKTGEDFQSFTLFPTNNKQDAWMLRATQAIWKKRILLDAAIRKNDFNSPIAAPNFSNTNVFKSFQVTVRIPKYPFVSAGYYPSSQLTLSDNNVLYENRYNTLNAIISHSYFVGKLNMNSNATYTKFYNSGSDTGFIYYNASTLTFNHSVNLEPFILQGIVTVTDQSFLHQTTIEPVLTYQLKNKLSISASAKWNRVNHTETLWGGTAGLNLYLKKIGVLQMQYDKIYLPGYSRNLLPVDMGRITFSREF
jgi:hypothetical protein